jgi:hypothetical protein
VTLIISYEPLAVTAATGLCLLAGAPTSQPSTKAVAKPKLLVLQLEAIFVAISTLILVVCKLELAAAQFLSL